MKRPNWKYTKNTSQDIGRELANPDYVDYAGFLEQQIKEIGEKCFKIAPVQQTTSRYATALSVFDEFRETMGDNQGLEGFHRWLIWAKNPRLNSEKDK